MRALFKEYPELRETLSFAPLAQLPTPVAPLERIAERHSIGGLFIKRDDVSGETYGGNKIRKLEFLLGDAYRSRAGAVLTFGAAGSNHALATAVYARRMGMDTISILIPQHNARYVRKNLLLSRYFGAQLHYFPDRASQTENIESIIKKYAEEYGAPPYIIPFGGTTPLGAIGFVNAAFELKRQIENGILKEPDVIYVAFGSMGTAAGLALGVRAAGLSSIVRAVRVVIPEIADEEKCASLLVKTNQLLHSFTGAFPLFKDPLRTISIEHSFFGNEYALFTLEGQKAVRYARETEGVILDGTYTGKTFAALLGDASAGKLKNRTVLFWNTLNSRDFSRLIEKTDYHELPSELHHYFTDDIQPLDRDDI